MSLLKVLKISESWDEVCKPGDEAYEEMEQDVKNCMSWLQDYFQTRKSTCLTHSETQALQKIQQNYKGAMRKLQGKQALLLSELKILRKGKESGRLYKDVATL